MTPKQSAFVAEYLVDKNATQAAIRAGYSPKTARQIGDENLSKPDIRSAIDSKMLVLAEKAGLSAELVLASLVRELKFDPADLYDQNGNLKPIHEIPAEARKCLVGIDYVTTGGDAPVTTTKVKWINPATAREQALKHLSMFKADNYQNQPPPITEIRLVAVRPKEAS